MSLYEAYWCAVVNLWQLAMGKKSTGSELMYTWGNISMLAMTASFIYLFIFFYGIELKENNATTTESLGTSH